MLKRAKQVLFVVILSVFTLLVILFFNASLQADSFTRNEKGLLSRYHSLKKYNPKAAIRTLNIL